MPSIALVGPSWPYRGGISRTTTELAAALQRRGSLAAFLVAARQYPRWLYPGTRDIDPNACHRLPMAEPAFGVLQPLSWWKLRRRLRELAPDAIVVPYWTVAWAPMTTFLAMGGRAPVVGVVHNPADHDTSWVGRHLSRAVLSRFSAFFCHAQAVERQLRTSFPATPVAVHPLAAEPPPVADRGAARTLLGVPDDAVTFLCLGLIRPYKGVDVLLQAMARLAPGSRAYLLLAGEPWGALAEEIRHELDDERLAGRVTARLEWVPEEDVATWLAAADVMVLPYRSATGSAVAAQALGWGLPVVASNVGGLAEVVNDRGNGLLVPPGDAGALAGAIDRLSDPSLRSHLAEGARRTASRWTWESYAEALEGLVDQAVSGAAATGA